MKRMSIMAGTSNGAGLRWAGCFLVTVLSGSALATEVPEPQHQSETPVVKPDMAKPDLAAKAVLLTPPAESSPTNEAQASVRRYCVNIAAAATDARFNWQAKKLQEVEVRVKARIAELDARQVELKAWLDRREQVNREARENLVGIYAKMRPETAAAQISLLSDETAAAVLAALTPRQASAIFNEMSQPERAAKLAGLLGNPMSAANEKKL